MPETVTEVLQGAFANEGALVKADMSRTASLKKWDKESFKGRYSTGRGYSADSRWYHSNSGWCICRMYYFDR